MRYLTLHEILAIYRRIMHTSGGASGISNLHGLEAALAQPYMTFDGVDLYPTIVEKAAILGFSLITNHPFLDGNKRIGHAAMEVFLVLNGFEIDASVDEQEDIILQVASGNLERQEFTEWLRVHIMKMI